MPTVEKRGAYYYQKINGRLVRVSGKTGGGRRPRRSRSRKRETCKPVIGDRVKILIKPYIDKYATGIVGQVLTRKTYHPRGHKVRLRNGLVGRVIAN